VARQCVCHDVGRPRLELDTEVEAKKFAGPLVLWYAEQPLVQQELETIVVGLMMNE
jgi:hypothetical protein